MERVLVRARAGGRGARRRRPRPHRPRRAPKGCATSDGWTAERCCSRSSSIRGHAIHGSRRCRRTAASGSTTPDNLYSSAGIDPNLEYRITGTRGTIAPPELRGTEPELCGGATASPASAGTPERRRPDPRPPTATASRSPRARRSTRNWLQLVAEHLDDPRTPDVRRPRRRGRPPTSASSASGSTSRRPAVVESAVPRQLLGAAMSAIGASPSWFGDWVAPWLDGTQPGQHFPEPEHHRLVGGDPNIVFQLGAWELGPDEALVIDVTPPVSRVLELPARQHLGRVPRQASAHLGEPRDRGVRGRRIGAASSWRTAIPDTRTGSTPPGTTTGSWACAGCGPRPIPPRRPT